MIYLDSSAIVKLIGPEPEGGALRTALAGSPTASSDLAKVEVLRAVNRRWPALAERAGSVLGGVVFVGMGAEVIRRAVMVQPTTVRSLDAIHIATALAFGNELDAMVTYDQRMAEAGRNSGIHVLAPA